MSKRIIVEGATPEGKVALWDRDAKHEGGEVFIVGGQRLEVEETSGVLAAIGDGRLARIYEEPAKNTKAEDDTKSGKK